MISCTCKHLVQACMPMDLAASELAVSFLSTFISNSFAHEDTDTETVI